MAGAAIDAEVKGLEPPSHDHDTGKTNEASPSFGFPSIIERVFSSKSITTVHRV